MNGSISPQPSSLRARPRVFLLGATGTIGQAVLRALRAQGYKTTCFLRPRTEMPADVAGADVRYGDVTDLSSVIEEGFRGDAYDAVISCMASRSGVPKDAWAVDYAAHKSVLQASISVGVQHFVLLSAICVQKPELAFQEAKLAFEEQLIASGLPYSIVRPTAFFKSLSGQVERVMAGKPYLLFGDGRGTACKPISDGDLADYIVGCLTDPDRHNRVLPIGGPGPAITPREQGEALFELLGRDPAFTSAPPWLMDAVAGTLGALAKIVPPLRTKAALAQIGRYYAKESMLLLDPKTGLYDANATPSTGSDTLFQYYAELVAAGGEVERGEHKVF